MVGAITTTAIITITIIAISITVPPLQFLYNWPTYPELN